MSPHSPHRNQVEEVRDMRKGGGGREQWRKKCREEGGIKFSFRLQGEYLL